MGYISHVELPDGTTYDIQDNQPAVLDIPNTPASIATFSGASNLPLSSLKVAIEPQQDLSHGDPSPENICPISGWDEAVVTRCGVNVWDEEWEVGGLNPLNGETTSENDRIRSKNFRPCKPNMTMFYYIPSGKGNLQIVFYDINKNYLSYYNFTTEHTFTTPNGCYFFKFNTGGSYGATYNNDISINYPSTDTEYHAYNGATYTIDLDGTRYGGVVDATNGVMTVDRAYVDMGAISWSYNGNGVFFVNNLSGLKLNGDAISSAYATTKSYPTVLHNDGTLWVSDIRNQIVVHNNAYTSASDFKTAMNGVQLVYELATPITVQLAPTQVKSLEGENNISANCGQITEGKYVISKYDGITAKISEVAYFAKKANKQVPEIHRKYESTSYYATTATQADSTWYFMSVKPDNWYKPWKVKFKVHTYCPNYPSYESITWSTFTGREQSLSYANFNERYDSAHYYISAATLKKAGFDAGYGHALGVSILYGGGYTTAAYYRTFEVDYYECENCTVTILDSPTKLTSWNGYSSTNYNNVSNYDAINRGLRETSDDNDGHYYSRRIYSNIKAGSNKIFPYTLIMQNADGRWESLVTSNSTGTSKTRNTHGFRLNQILYMSANATYNENAVVGTYAINEFFGNLLDHRYFFNTANDSTNGTAANTPIYLVGSINATDGLFYLDTKWWTQTLPTSDDGKLYIYIGDAYDYYRMIYSSNHPIYWYKGGKLQEYSQSSNYAVSAGSATSATTASKLGSSNVGSATQPIYLSAGTAAACTYTLGKSVPSDAVFTDTQANWAQTTTTALDYIKNKPTFGTALTLSGTTVNHDNYGSSGTAGTSSATHGATLAVPYIKTNAQGHVTGKGTHTHTVDGLQYSTDNVSRVVMMSDGQVSVQTKGYLSCNNYANTGFKPMTASAFNVSSSRKVKENIEPIADEEAYKLLDVTPVSFDYISEIGGAKNQFGVIAEEVNDILPFVVSIPEDYKEDDGNYMNVPSVDYSKFIPHLIKLVQIQEQKINDLQQEIFELKNK